MTVGNSLVFALCPQNVRFLSFSECPPNTAEWMVSGHSEKNVSVVKHCLLSKIVKNALRLSGIFFSFIEL